MVVRFYGLVHWEDPMDEALGPASSSYSSAENAVTKDGILHYKAGTSYLGKEQWKPCFVVLRWALGWWVRAGVTQGSWEKVLGAVCCPRAAWKVPPKGTKPLIWWLKPPFVGAQQQECDPTGLCGWEAGQRWLWDQRQGISELS